MLQNDEDGRRECKSSKKKKTNVNRTVQVMERIPEHTVESFDQEELDQLRHDWLMGAFELQNDEDGRRERKSSKKKGVNRTRLKHPDALVMLSPIAAPRLLIHVCGMSS